jgi:hypothetical protein
MESNFLAQSQFVLLVVLLCAANAPEKSQAQNKGAGYGREILFQMENDRLGGSDDYHTDSFRLLMQLTRSRPEAAFSINYESLTQRHENVRVDLLGIEVALGYPAWTGGRLAFSGGFAVNGDLGGQSFQNAIHEWLGESTLHLAYPGVYAFGLAAGVRLDQRLASFGPFRLDGSWEAKAASNAAPSWIQGGVYLQRPIVHSRGIDLNIQAGLSVADYFRLDEILNPYYGKGFSLDARIHFAWRHAAIKAFFLSNPYGIHQGILGVGIGCRF